MQTLASAIDSGVDPLCSTNWTRNLNESTFKSTFIRSPKNSNESWLKCFSLNFRAFHKLSRPRATRWPSQTLILDHVLRACSPYVLTDWLSISFQMLTIIRREYRCLLILILSQLKSRIKQRSGGELAYRVAGLFNVWFISTHLRSKLYLLHHSGTNEVL